MNVNANTVVCAGCATGFVAVRDRDAATVVVIFERLGHKKL